MNKSRNDINKMTFRDTLGGYVDAVFLSLPSLIKPFMPQRVVERDRFEAELEFYFSKGYIEDPARFFTGPSRMPDYDVIETESFMEGRRELISFKSGYTPANPLVRERFEGYAENKKGYLVRWTHGDARRKTVLCLHGFMLGDPRQAEKMFQVGRLFSMGLDVALFIAPFHWRRSPESSFRRGIFLQPEDPAMSCECFGQAMHDLNISFRILQDMGAAETGIIGASLGGYLAALFVSLNRDPFFVSLIVPAVNMSRPFGVESASLPFKMDTGLMEKAARVWELHSPLHFQPLIDRNNILIIASRGDRLCPFDHVVQLCDKWQWPGHQFLTGGHWLIFNNRLRGRAWYSFLRETGFIHA